MFLYISLLNFPPDKIDKDICMFHTCHNSHLHTPDKHGYLLIELKHIHTTWMLRPKMGDSGQSRLRLQTNSLIPIPTPTPVAKKLMTPTPAPTPATLTLTPTRMLLVMDLLQHPWLRLRLQANGFTPTLVLTPVIMKCLTPTPVIKKILSWLQFRLRLQIVKKRSRLQVWLRLRSRNRPSLIPGGSLPHL